jgi:outer membrane protein assembly factor BamB
MKRIAYVFLFTALAGGAAASGEWAGFRGPSGSGVSEEAGLPTKWGKDEGLRWKVALPGRGLSNPVIAGGRVYLTACSGYREKRLHVLCLDEATGKRLWERQFAATGSTACHPMTNMAAPTPVTDGRAVYALFATGDLAAIDRDGTLRWYRSLVGDYPQVTNQVGMAASPVLAGDVLCLPMENAGDSFVAGVDKHTGKNLWRRKRASTINWVTPLVLNADTVLFQNDGEATAVDPKTGKERWNFQGGLTSIPSPTHGDGVVFLTGGQIRAVRPRQDGSKPEVVWEGPAITGGYPSPVYHRGQLYGLTNAAVVCLSAADGKEVWRQRVEGPFAGSPVIADGRLYAVNQKGRAFVVDVSGEKPKLLARNDVEDTILATPAIANGGIYLRSDKWLYCVGAKK